ncbi:MAG: methionyl aminopeptidase [Betaproteobacteria bacterium]|jgi:methionyl aminopeptidase
MIANNEDRELLTEAGYYLSTVMTRVLDYVEKGMTTKELDDHIARIVTSEGHKSAPQIYYDFPSFSCISLNDEAAHGVAGDRIISDDLVKIDISIVHSNGMCADMCRTVYFGEDPKYEYLASLGPACFENLMNADLKPGDSVVKIGKLVEEFATDSGVFVIDSLYGHGIGRSLHEEPNIPNVFNLHAMMNAPTLNEGEVFCIEPMFLHNPTHVSQYGDVFINVTGAWSSHHEDMFLLTSEGLTNLTCK